MFGRRDSTAAPAAPAAGTPDAQGAVRPGAKGRPTPKRSEAEKASRHPLVGGAPRAAKPASGASKEERKAFRLAERERRREETRRVREAYDTGDERYLPARDKGPARRFARDVVDSRRNLGEFFLPVAVVLMLLSIIPQATVRIVTLVLIYGMVAGIGVDAFFVRRRVQRLADEKFGRDKAAGAGAYAMMRTLQMRRTRLPRALVKYGERPY